MFFCALQVTINVVPSEIIVGYALGSSSTVGYADALTLAANPQDTMDVRSPWDYEWDCYGMCNGDLAVCTDDGQFSETCEFENQAQVGRVLLENKDQIVIPARQLTPVRRD